VGPEFPGRAITDTDAASEFEHAAEPQLSNRSGTTANGSASVRLGREPASLYLATSRWIIGATHLDWRQTAILTPGEVAPVSTTIELNSFQEILDFSHNQTGNPKALMGRTTDLVGAIEWALFEGPERVDRSYLPLVSDGVKGLIKDLGNIGKSSEEEEASPESAYAIYKLCDWRAQTSDIIGSWLSGWWTHDDEGEIKKTPVVAGLGDSLRVLQFSGWWIWRFYISPSGNRLRRQCHSFEDVEPPKPPEESVQPPLPFDSTPQQQCASLEELAAFLGVKFGGPCPDEVMHAYRTRLDYTPNDIDTLWDLARCYARQKDYQQAIRAYRDVLQDRPEFHDARKELIVCLAALQQWDAASAEARYLEGFSRVRPEAQLAQECLQSLRYNTQD